RAFFDSGKRRCGGASSGLEPDLEPAKSRDLTTSTTSLIGRGSIAGPAHAESRSSATTLAQPAAVNLKRSPPTPRDGYGRAARSSSRHSLIVERKIVLPGTPVLR